MTHLYRELYSNHSRNLALLRSRFPAQLLGSDANFLWPNGWNDIVTVACQTIDILYPEACWRRIREKQGRLQLHATCAPVMVVGADAEASKEATTQIIRVEAQLLDRLDAFWVQSGSTCARCCYAGQLLLLNTGAITLCDHCVRPIMAARLADMED